MDIATYSVEAAVEETHWWFVGRRLLFAREIERLGLKRDAAILDVGSSTGTNLRMLTESGFRNVCGLDLSDESVRWCAQKRLPPVRTGDVCAMPFADARFDLVLATDIIEHVDDDGLAISEIARVLKPGGAALITVPAFMSLWGLQDNVSHHRRRYRMQRLLTVASAPGLKVMRSYYFNSLLFGPIWLARQIIRLLDIKLRSENEVNSRLINRLLTAIFRTDVALAPHLDLPFGVSALVLVRKPG